MRLLSTLAGRASTASSLFSVAVAAPIADQAAMHQATADFALVQKTRFFWDGRDYRW